MLNLSGRELITIPESTLGRRAYFNAGLALMLLKYTVDAGLIYLTTGILWTPVDYALSLANVANSKAALFTPGLSVTLLIWTIPFVWVGVLLSVRRARDAGLPAWIVVAFFIPALNYVLMTLLSLWPTAPAGSRPAYVQPGKDDEERARARRGLIAGIFAGLAAGLGSIALGALAIRSYGGVMFMATPFIIGFASGYTARRVNPAAKHPLAVVLYTLGVIAAGCIVFALEGVACLLMAAPLAIPLAVLGGMVGHSVAGERTAPGTVTMLLVLLPVGHGIDRALTTAPTRVVLSAIEVDAPADVVWRHVVSFDEIRTPPPFYFRAGLAYPIRARIDGTGVGAVRHCEFSTGPFVEPITAWEAPHRLAFDVVAQPAPLQEWSPYRKVYAPHLQGFFRTTKGEFRLIPLEGNRTRLEGRTWYSLRMQPQLYWTPIADAVVHGIHGRVLEHIRAGAERGRR